MAWWNDFSVSTLYCFQFLEIDDESNVEWMKIMRQSGEDVRKKKEHGKLFLFVKMLVREKETHVKHGTMSVDPKFMI